MMLPRRAFLGIELAADEVAFTPEGVAVADVRSDGMAAAAALRAGDVIESIAGVTVRTLPELARALRVAGASAHVEIRARRDGVSFARTAAACTHPREDAIYDALAVDGATLRTIATPGAPTVVVIQGIACESIDHATTPEAPLAGLVRGWARAGVGTLRVDKRGLGDSTGSPCCAIDFETELADFRAALALAPRPRIAFGHSVGGIIAALLAGELDGIIVYGAPVMRWLACLVDTTRRQLAMRGANERDIEAAAADLADRARRDGLNGRTAAYHAQLDAIDIEAAWRAVTTRVLVLRGEHDWVVRPDDQARIATLARGGAEIVDLPGLDHMFGHHTDREASLRDYGSGSFDPSIVAATLEWLDRGGYAR
jgi:uncharacterized protein